MLKRSLSSIVAILLLPGLALARTAPKAQRNAAVKLVQQFASRADLTRHLRAMGYQARGGIEKSKTDHDDDRLKSFPHFTSSFTTGGVTYPFTMVGHPPASGRATNLRSVIIPLRMNFVGFGPNQDVNFTFEPGAAVTNMVNSPLYEPAQFPNGFGQFGDQMQRAAFWNKMDAEHRWHVRMNEPRVTRTIDIEVTPAIGTLSQVGSDLFGDVPIDFMDSQIRTILQFMDIGPDQLPIFVTGDCTAQALGYHNAFSLGQDDGTEILQTYLYTSWLDPTKVDPLFADVSTFNHELAEWMNDPYVNNLVPDWNFPPPTDPAAICSGNPLLEVGDPQGNGPTFADFPTAVVTLKGVSYHLQQLVLWQWFAAEVPSSAFHGWYTFPIPDSLTVPAVYCP
jgi:hypothetical protein